MAGIKGPIAPQSNPPINPQYYQPSQFVITAVTLGKTTIVTTASADNYVVGQQVRLLIPTTYGCVQLNGAFGYVISLPSPTQVEVAIDSSNNVNSFVAGTGKTSPQIIPIGDINTGQINSSGTTSNITYIPGSFINISPL